MNGLEKWTSNLNKNQRVIVAIGLLLFLFFLNIKLAGVIGDNRNGTDRPFHFEETWWVWAMFTIIVGYLEYRLFEQKK